VTAPPLVFVVGGDRFSVADRFREERERMHQSAGEVGLEVLDGDDPEAVGRALDAVRTPAMFGGHRVVALLGSFDAEALTKINEWGEAPGPDCTLLVAHVQQGAQTKALKALQKFAAESGALVEVAPAPRRQQDLDHWVRQRASAVGVTFTADAERAVAGALGSDAGALDALLHQLAAAHPGVRVGADEVRPYLSGTKTVQPWDLTDAIDRGDVAGALGALHGLKGMHPLQIQATLSGHFRRLRLALSLRSAGAQQLQTEFGMKPYPAKKLAAQLRHVDTVSADRAHHLVLKAEEALHGASGLDAETVMDMLVVRLARVLGSRRR
jgi:DNA polymerase III delta subunit